MQHQESILGKPSGLLWTWWRGDALPQLPPLSNFTVVTSTDVTLLAHLIQASTEYVAQRIQAQHRPYIASINDTPVAVGWSATDQAEFAEGLVHFRVPDCNRYFYFFVTLPEWRRRGVYTHLLQTILRIESSENERFWVLHEIENIASERGIVKAGFQLVSTVYFLDNGTVCFIPSGDAIERARVGAAMFGLPLIENA